MSIDTKPALFLHCSPHGEHSHGYSLGKRTLAERLPTHGLLERDLTADPLPPIGREYATALTSGQVDHPTLAISETLIRELEQTDALVIATPMHNFTVPASLKLWIDLVLRIGRSFASTPEGKVGLIADRPTLVLVSSGGFHQGERARQPDFLTAYLRQALLTIGITSVEFVYLEGMVFGPAAVDAALTAAHAGIPALRFPG